MGWLDVMVSDDRGRRVALMSINALRDPSNRMRWADHDSGELAARLAAVSAAQRPRRTLVLAIIIFVGVASTTGLLIWLVLSGWLPRTALPVAGPVVGLVLGVGVRRWRQRERSGAMLGTILVRRRCGSCGYALAGCVVEPDGCVSCPECNAAWSVKRMEAEHLAAGDRLPGAPPAPAGAMQAGALEAGVLALGGRGWMRWRYVEDARGVRVPIADYRLRGVVVAPGDASGRAERLESARRALKPGPGRYVLMVVIGAGVLFVLWMQIQPLLRSVGSLLATSPRSVTLARVVDLAVPVLGILFWLALGVVWALIGYRRGLSPRAQRVQAALLGRNLCASCAGELAKPAEDALGVRSCAACGARWR